MVDVNYCSLDRAHLICFDAAPSFKIRTVSSPSLALDPSDYGACFSTVSQFQVCYEEMAPNCLREEVIRSVDSG